MLIPEVDYALSDVVTAVRQRVKDSGGHGRRRNTALLDCPVVTPYPDTSVGSLSFVAERFVVRRLRPSDYDAVGELTVAAYLADGYLEPGDDYAQELRDTGHRDREAEVWLAERRDGVLFGAVTFCPPGSSYREVSHDDEGEFRSLAVDLVARGAGVGAALSRHCLDRSRELGLAGVALCSMDSMATAHRLYERLGFLRDPARDWSPHPGVHLLGFALRF